MSEIPFAYTVQGRRFFEQSVPDAIAALDRLNATLVELINVLDRLAPHAVDAGQQHATPHSRVPVPRSVFDGIEAVRCDGRTNMLDNPVVAELADELGFPDAARWLRANRALYAQAVFHGFEVTDETGGDEPPQPKEI
jgi:hypothetical protein